MKIEKISNGNVLLKEENGVITSVLPASMYVHAHPVLSNEYILLSGNASRQHRDAIEIKVSDVTTTIVGGVSTAFSGTAQNLITTLSNNFFFRVSGSSGAVLDPVNANVGVAVVLGTLKFQMATSGNRSLQVASNTGFGITLIATSYGSTGAGNGVSNLSLVAAGTFQSIKSTLNFVVAGYTQSSQLYDKTNERRYMVYMEVGAFYNNNVFSGFEL